MKKRYVYTHKYCMSNDQKTLDRIIPIGSILWLCAAQCSVHYCCCCLYVQCVLLCRCVAALSIRFKYSKHFKFCSSRFWILVSSHLSRYCRCLLANFFFHCKIIVELLLLYICMLFLCRSRREQFDMSSIVLWMHCAANEIRFDKII